MFGSDLNALERCPEGGRATWFGGGWHPGAETGVPVEISVHFSHLKFIEGLQAERFLGTLVNIVGRHPGDAPWR